MTQGRAERQRAIVDMLREGSARTQEEVAAHLADAGYEVTQATVARDLEQVGAVKVKREGKLGYSLPEKLGDRNWPADRLQRIFAEWVQGVETSGNLVVVRTPPGSAHLVALAVDQAKLPEVVGTIAGDDVLFIAVRSSLPAEPLAQRLRDLMRYLADELTRIHDAERVERMLDRVQRMDPAGRREALQLVDLELADAMLGRD
jgi:transcriptional regulator of arginine metabolism